MVRCMPQTRARLALALTRLDADLAFVDLILDEIVEHLHRQRALRALDRQGLALDGRA